MTEHDTPEAEIDAASVKREEDRIAASLIVRDRFRTRHAFPVTWRHGHAGDWTWQGEDSWLQTEVNAEHLGIEPARLIALADQAVAAAASTLESAPDQAS